MGVIREDDIRERGRAIFAAVRGKAPTLFNRSWWTGKAMEAAMTNEAFKVQLFRFIDCLPSLRSSAALARHLEEYFGAGIEGMPAAVRLGAEAAGGLFAGAVRANIEKMARLFIGGATPAEVVKTVSALRKSGYAFTVDRLGEATVSEHEAAAFQKACLELLDHLGAASQGWPALDSVIEDGDEALDWGYAPPVNISLKPTAFCSQVRPADVEGSAAGIRAGLKPVLLRASQLGAFVNLDMEQYRYREITLKAYRGLREEPELRDWPHFGVVLQAYLADAEQDLEDLLLWSGRRDLPLPIRLVKGAYWDYETVIARQHGWRLPVRTSKAATDAAFERMARRILENHERCYLSCASHNIRSLAAVLESAAALGVPRDRYEFQVLYGMAEPVRRALLEEAGTVRLYVPYGELLPGLSYLVRRLLENTSNESFVRRRFVEAEEEERLLENPASLASDGVAPETVPDAAPGTVPPFRNHPLADFTNPALRESFRDAVAAVRRSAGGLHPLVIDGKEVETSVTLTSVNPAEPEEIIGLACQADTGEADHAVAAARRFFPEWRRLPAKERAAALFRAAEIARGRIVSLAAWQVLEAGKQWDQAYGDVAEAVDYFEFYGREILRLAPPRDPGSPPGERNRYFYQPRGVAAVIAPWNFPLAISAGMTAAALAAGCTVVYKPSNLTPVTGALLAGIYRDAGVPAGAFHYLPGPGGTVGRHLVDHPEVGLVVFTGSREVGLDIVARAAKVHPGQGGIKRVIAEMGGKNAAIIDDDADLDEAVLEVVASAFGYQGQKCSACSRVIVLADIHEAFTDRLVEAVRSLSVGPAENPAHYLGPVIDTAAREKILGYVEVGRDEGVPLMVRTEAPGPGYYAPVAIFDGVTPDRRLAREEIFGPVLSVMKADSFGEALRWAGSTSYALTGSVFSRSPGNLALAEREFRVGNLYLNRGCTGALVGRQPFGGFGMSGIGSKAGGPDYLLQFLEPRTVTENTMRRGFAPAEG